MVLHPVHGPGLDTALAALPGVDLVTPGDGDGVAAALGAGAAVLVTYPWEGGIPGYRARIRPI